MARERYQKSQGTFKYDFNIMDHTKIRVMFEVITLQTSTPDASPLKTCTISEAINSSEIIGKNKLYLLL